MDTRDSANTRGEQQASTTLKMASKEERSTIAKTEMSELVSGTLENAQVLSSFDAASGGNTAETMASFSNFLEVVKPNFENVIVPRLQRINSGVVAEESQSVDQNFFANFFQKTPKDVLYILILSIVILLYFLAQNLFAFAILIGTIGLCVVLSNSFNFFATQTETNALKDIDKMQLELVQNESAASKKTAAELADKAIVLQQNRDKTFLQVKEIQANTRDKELKTFQDIRLAETKSNEKIQGLREAGMKDRELIKKEKDENVASIGADAVKTKAKIEADSAQVIRNIGLQESVLQEETKRIDSKNKKEVSEKEAEIRNETHKREVKFKSTQDANRITHEANMRNAELSVENEKHARQVSADTQVKLGEFDVTKHRATEETRRAEINKPQPRARFLGIF